jgi:hypothetical protein
MPGLAWNPGVDDPELPRGDVEGEGPGSDFSTHGHYINMTSTSYTMVACGFYAGGGGVWATQDFR